MRKPTDVTFEIPDDFVDAFARCIDHLGQHLVPPYGGMPINEIVTVLRDVSQADAVSLFLVSEDDPNSLECAVGRGYRREHDQKRYYLQAKALTSWVYRTGEAINWSRNEIEERAKKLEIDYSGSCIVNIKTGQFTNLIAVPVLFGRTRLGVLKIENKKGSSPDECFPQPDFALARMLAPLIAVAHQQRLCRDRWSACEDAKQTCRSSQTYLERVTEILSKWLNAEAASVFLKEHDQEGREILRFRAGVGYKETDCKYEVNAEALTAYVYRAREAVHHTETQLTQQVGKGIPYSGACRSHIRSGTFRGVVAVPLVDGPDCLGVLKVENKLPEDAQFEPHDQQICEAVVKGQILPTLLQLRSHEAAAGPPATDGYRLLVSKFPPPRRLKKEALIARVKDVVDFMRKNPGLVRPGDCAEYLQISRPHFYRLKRAALAG